MGPINVNVTIDTMSNFDVNMHRLYSYQNVALFKIFYTRRKYNLGQLDAHRVALSFSANIH